VFPPATQPDTQETTVNDLIRRTLQAQPTPPTTPVDALLHTIALSGQNDDDFAVIATSNVYGHGVRTGLTWGDLRALAAQLS